MRSRLYTITTTIYIHLPLDWLLPAYWTTHGRLIMEKKPTHSFESFAVFRFVSPDTPLFVAPLRRCSCCLEFEMEATHIQHKKTKSPCARVCDEISSVCMNTVMGITTFLGVEVDLNCGVSTGVENLASMDLQDRHVAGSGRERKRKKKSSHCSIQFIMTLQKPPPKKTQYRM